MPNAIAVVDLGQGVGLWTLEVAPCDPATGHCDLPHLPVGNQQFVGPPGDRAILDGNQAHLHALQGVSDTNPETLFAQFHRFGQDFPAGDGQDRYSLGGTVGGVHLGRIHQQAAEGRDIVR